MRQASGRPALIPKPASDLDARYRRLAVSVPAENWSSGSGYVVKHKDGRRNRYQIQAHLPLPEADSRESTIGEILALLTGADDEATA